MLWTFDAPAGDVGAVVKVVEVDGRQLDGVDLLTHPDRLCQSYQSDIVGKNVVLFMMLIKRKLIHVNLIALSTVCFTNFY